MKVLIVHPTDPLMVLDVADSIVKTGYLVLPIAPPPAYLSQPAELQTSVTLTEGYELLKLGVLQERRPVFVAIGQPPHVMDQMMREVGAFLAAAYDRAVDALASS